MIKFIGEFNKLLRSPTVNGTVAIFETEEALKVGAKSAFQEGFRKFDTLTPYPIHGMDDIMGLKRSPVPWFTLIFGALGLVFGLGFQWWTSAVSWDLNVGGKPPFSIPAFIPITFEMTVLFGGLCSVAGMLWLCGLPKVDPPILDPDITCHKFAVFIPENDHGYDEGKIWNMMKSAGAVDIRKTEF